MVGYSLSSCSLKEGGGALQGRERKKAEVGMSPEFRSYLLDPTRVFSAYFVLKKCDRWPWQLGVYVAIITAASRIHLQYATEPVVLRLFSSQCCSPHPAAPSARSAWVRSC